MPAASAPATSASASSPTMTASSHAAGGAGKRALEEIRRRLAEQHRLPPRGVFERRHEGAGVKAEFAVSVLEGAVAGERQKFGAGDQLAEGGVQRFIGKGLAGIADNHRFALGAVNAGEILFERRMNQKVSGELPGCEAKSFAACAGVNSSGSADGDTHLLEAQQQLAPRRRAWCW